MSRKNITKSFITALLLLILLFTEGFPVSAEDNVSIYVNGYYLNTDVPPVVIEGRTMVPLRAVSEAVGCKVAWREEDQSIIVYTPVEGDPLIVMAINDPYATVNWYNYNTGDFGGDMVLMDVPPVLFNDRTMVPLRFVAETIGFVVEWDSDTQSVYMYNEYI